MNSSESWIRFHDNGWIGMAYECGVLEAFIGGAAPANDSRSAGLYPTAELARLAADRDTQLSGKHRCSANCGHWYRD